MEPIEEYPGINENTDSPEVRVIVDEIEESQIPESIRIVGAEIDENFNLDTNGTPIMPNDTEINPIIQDIPFLQALNQDEAINELNKTAATQYSGIR